MMIGCQDQSIVFEKLNGQWVNHTEKNTVTAERWEKSGSHQWKAIGWTLQNGDTLFKEKMVILETDSGWYYKAHPAIAQRPTFFKIQTITDTGFVAVNPKHDYPQSIHYHFEKTHLRITIQGRPNFEEELTEEWTLERMNY